MKKTFIYLGLGLLMLSACGKKEADTHMEDSLKIEQLTSDYNQATSFNDSLMLLMGDIYSGLDSINMQEGLLYNMGKGEGVDRRAEIRENLANIKARLAANKQVLEQMEAKLKASGNENSVLAKTIEQMKERIAQQDARIAALEGELKVAQDSITDLNRQVVQTQEQVAQTQEQLQTQTEATEAAQAAYTQAENELNTVYYAIGTNKELKQNGLLEKKFLSATKVMQGNFNQAYFTKADKRELTSIPTTGKKIKIWTNMPANSYSEIENPDKTITLKITNPNDFWSLTPYLIIQIDK